MNQTNTTESKQVSSIEFLKKCYGEISFGFIPYILNESGVVLYLLVEHQHGGGWSFPKGKVEGKETEIETAMREVREEAGLKKDDFEYVSEEYVFVTYEYFKKRIQKLVKKFAGYFVARLKKSSINNVKIREREIKSYGFFTYDEVLVKMKKMKSMIESAQKIISDKLEKKEDLTKI